MKRLKHTLGTLLIITLLFTSCNKNNDDVDIIIRPTAEDFSNLKQEAIDELTQNFQLNTDDSTSISLTSDKGVSININSSCLTLDGNAVTGIIDVEFIELFDKGNMLTTNKPTMGTLPNGDKALLISGGEFLLNITQNGDALETSCAVSLIVPSNLTGGTDNTMSLWEGAIDENDNLAWEQAEDATGQGGVFGEGGQYYVFLQQFGWSNIDRFYNDPRPKTTILAQAPDGYDYTNSAIYLSYDGEDTGLASLDTFEDGFFSEHYGQIPIGLECHVIFVSEDAGSWKYAIKAVTIAENDIITFSEEETTIVNENQLIAIINDLP